MKKALRDTLPTFLAYFPLGIVFGYLFVEMGFPWFLAPIMSALVYGGSVQFLALSLLATGGTLLDVAIGGLLLSLRNFFFGFAFLDRKEGSLLSRFYLMFGLVDTTYSLLLADQTKDPRYATRVTYLVHAYWIVGTLLGAIVTIPSIPYIEFALPALVTCLAIDLWQTKPALVAAASASIAALIFPSQLLLIATVISATFLISTSKKSEVLA